MFHVRQTIEKLKSIPIWELMFYFFVLTVPFQLRTILNLDSAYIGYYFSYHKAIFIYVSDIAFVAFLIASAYFQKNTSITENFSLKLIIWPILWSFISLFHVEQFWLGLYGALKVAELWLVVGYMRNNPSVARGTISVLIGSGLFQALIGIAQSSFQRPIGLEWLGEYLPSAYESGAATIRVLGEPVIRAYGTMPHPNVLGGFIAISLGLLMVVSRETALSIKNGILIASGVFVLTWGLLVSYSRSAWLAALALSIIISGYQLTKKPVKQAIFWPICLAISGVILTAFYAQTVIPRSTESVDNSNSAIIYREKFNAWSKQVIRDNLWLGVGQQQYVPELQDKLNVEQWAYQPPHNVILLLLAELGLIGVLVWGYTLIKLCFTWNIYLLVLGPILLILGFLDHYPISIQQGQLMAFLLLGLFVSQVSNMERFHIEDRPIKIGE
jgi:O-antigen ligase